MKITQIFFTIMIITNTLTYATKLGVGYSYIKKLGQDSLVENSCILTSVHNNLNAMKYDVKVRKCIQEACGLLEKDLLMAAFSGELNNALTDDELKSAIETILLYDKEQLHQEMQKFKTLRKELQERYNERDQLDPRKIIVKK